MNISMMTADEILRTCEPVTQLEKRLFEVFMILKKRSIGFKDC